MPTTYVAVDLQEIKHNVDKISRRLAEDAQLIAVVKGKASVHGVPPDFMGAGALSDKLAAQLTKFSSQHTVGHTGTRSSV